MERPWVKPEQVKDYTASAKVLQRSDTQLAFDIARAEKYTGPAIIHIISSRRLNTAADCRRM